MAGAPIYKVYSPSDEYVASFKYPEDAAILVAARGEGWTIRCGHSRRHIRWTEGAEDQPASESYDYVAQTVYDRSGR